jgi:2-deoxy-D-gluconate 3-dehydrogenase
MRFDLTERIRREVPGWHDAVARRTPAGRWGTIDDLRGIAVFLAAPASDFVTGAAITVDGSDSIQG